ncbi:MAG: hypothetical protein H7327_10805 [Herminiimonas sp.]|nr:hypothetical protein [Herminiimonas sp.]
MKKIIPLVLILLTTACATPTVVQTRQVTDAGLTCEQIKNEIAEAERYEKAARKDRTVTGTNVAAAILFWPALIGTYSNTEEAINAAKERRENMMALNATKHCKA